MHFELTQNEETANACSAPTARNVKAWGNAPGSAKFTIAALKARNRNPKLEWNEEWTW